MAKVEINCIILFDVIDSRTLAPCKEPAVIFGKLRNLNHRALFLLKSHKLVPKL